MVGAGEDAEDVELVDAEVAADLVDELGGEGEDEGWIGHCGR